MAGGVSLLLSLALCVCPPKAWVGERGLGRRREVRNRRLAIVRMLADLCSAARYTLLQYGSRDKIKRRTASIFAPPSPPPTTNVYIVRRRK